MNKTVKRAAVAVVFGATLATVGIGETRAMPIPVTTSEAIAGAPVTEQVGWGWRRGCCWGGWGWRHRGWGWGGGALAAGLIVGGLIGAATAAPYYGYGYGYYPAHYGYRPYGYYPRYYGYRRAFYRPYWGYRRAYYGPRWGYRRAFYRRGYYRRAYYGPRWGYRRWGYRRAYWR